jgi:hypothetical protein
MMDKRLLVRGRCRPAREENIQMVYEILCHEHMESAPLTEMMRMR